jgi:hypothetical protein
LPEHVAKARINALDVYHLERHLHLDVEHPLNEVLSASWAHPLAVAANYTYAISHFAVTTTVLVWLYAVHPGGYRQARSVLLITTALALLGFWLYPLAPPRLFPQLGFVDTVVQGDTWGSWGSTTVSQMSNQYAAMPSVHLAWSVWSAWALTQWSSHRWGRATAFGYPLLVLLVILGTANHWMLDAVGGVAAVLVAGWLWSAFGASEVGSIRGAGRTFAPGPLPQGCRTLDGEAPGQRREAVRVDHTSERA